VQEEAILKKNSKNKKQLIDELKQIIMSRKPITYTPIDLFLWAISCMYLFCFKVCI